MNFHLDTRRPEPIATQHGEGAPGRRATLPEIRSQIDCANACCRPALSASSSSCSACDTCSRPRTPSRRPCPCWTADATDLTAPAEFPSARRHVAHLRRRADGYHRTQWLGQVDTARGDRMGALRQSGGAWHEGRHPQRALRCARARCAWNSSSNSAGHRFRVVRGLTNAECYLDGGDSPIASTISGVTELLQRRLGMTRDGVLPHVLHRAERTRCHGLPRAG